MEYLLTFLEGFASFISPCLLPMLPIYISYFMGDEQENRKKAVFNSIGFVSGFTFISFCKYTWWIYREIYIINKNNFWNNYYFHWT